RLKTQQTPSRQLSEAIALPFHIPAKHRSIRANSPWRPANRRHLIGTCCVCDLAAQAHQKPHLRPKAHVGLMITKTVAWRGDVDVARQKRITVHKDAFPRYLDFVAQQHAVCFVVAVGERRVEFRRATELEWLP